MMQAFYVDLILGVPQRFTERLFITHKFTVEHVEVNVSEPHIVDLNKLYVDGTDLFATETGLGSTWDAFQFTPAGGSAKLAACECCQSLQINGSYAGFVPAGKTRGAKFTLQIVMRGPS
jgi:hypothetical protein